MRQSLPYILLTLLLLAACTEDEEPRQGVTINLWLQPEENVASRALGDPGTYEHFELPKYAYVYFVADGKVVELDGGGNLMELDDEHWSKGRAFESAVPQTMYDSAYTYGSLAKFSIDGITTEAKVYVAACNKKLKKGGVDIPTLPTGTDESEVLNITFDLDNELKDNLQNIYSTPYNYRPAIPPYNGRYFGTIQSLEGSSTLPVRLYHVAAKVDLMWNVPKAQQPTLQISHIEARRLKQNNCYLFRPTENTWTTAGAGNDEDNNYTVTLMDDDIGRQWYGRQYFYTIPYKYTPAPLVSGDYFDVNLHMRKIGGVGDGYNLTLRRDVSGDDPVFVPWHRADLVFTNGMDYKTVIKTIE